RESGAFSFVPAKSIMIWRNTGNRQNGKMLPSYVLSNSIRCTERSSRACSPPTLLLLPFSGCRKSRPTWALGATCELNLEIGSLRGFHLQASHDPRPHLQPPDRRVGISSSRASSSAEPLARTNKPITSTDIQSATLCLSN